MRNYNKTAVIISILLVSFSGFAEEDDDETTPPLEELFLSETVFPQEKGEWQVSGIFQFDKSDDSDSSTFTTEIEYGVTDQFQIGLEYSPYIRINSDEAENINGAGNLELGLKYTWTNINDTGLSIAIGYEHEFATGDSEVVGEDGEDAEDGENLFLILAKNIDEDGNTQGFIQLGSEFQDNEEEPYINLGLYSNLGKYTLSGELNWSEEQTFITPGITWRPADEWSVGIGVPIAVDGESDYKVIGIITYEWG